MASKNTFVTVTAKRGKKAPASKGACIGVSINAAKNGFTVDCRYDRPMDGDTSPADYQPHVAESLDDALEIARTELGGKTAAPAAPVKKAAPAKAMPAVPAAEPDGDEEDEEEEDEE
jgi:hypothetical protein